MDCLRKAEGFYSYKRLKELYEETGKSLRSSTWARVAARVKKQNITTKYMGVASNGDILFKTKSGTTPGKFWNQRIRFKDYETALQILNRDMTLRNKDIIRLLVAGDILVFCDDHSFKYYWKYKAWAQGYGIEKETRYPKVRNPYLTGGVCKHLYAVLSVLPFHIPQITGDYVKKGLLPKR